MKKEFITTEDGSHTLYVPELKEHYHSIHGAVQESMHVFIDAGYKHIAPKHNSLNILEVGFGTGLNAFLTYLESLKSSKKVNYIGVEAFPLEADVYRQLNYHELVAPDKEDVFLKMHETNWVVPFFINDFFILNKLHEKIEDIGLQPDQMHLVYFDAFAPTVQPELWEKDIFANIYQSLVDGGVLVTYSSKASVARALKEVGFMVENLPGPKGKREITRATKI